MNQLPALGLGYRPLFLLGAIWACVLSAVWSMSISGVAFTGLEPTGYIYEMVYGFSGTIVVGLLLTFNLSTEKSNRRYQLPLIILCVIWAVARSLSLLQIDFYKVVFDFLFYAYSFYLLSPYLLKSYKKYVWIIFSIFFSFLINLSLPLIGIKSDQSLYYSFVALLLLVFVVANKFIPYITKRTLLINFEQTSKWIQCFSVLFYMIWLMLLFLSNDYSYYSSYFAALGLLPIFLLIKKWPWRKAFEVPMLAMLYTSYLWLLFAMFFDALNLLPVNQLFRPVLIHILSYGFMGGMILSMVSQVSLRFTCKSPQASIALTISYFIFHTGAVVQVFGSILKIDLTLVYTLASMFWIMSFLIYILEYACHLIQARNDSIAL